MTGAKGSLVVTDLFDYDSVITGREWKPLAEGVYISPIYRAGEGLAHAALLHYRPGADIGEHLHQGFEHILILHGSQQDGEKIYQSGSLVVHWPGTSHRISSPEGCLALGIWEKPVKFL